MKDRLLEIIKRSEVSIAKVKDHTPGNLKEFSEAGIVRDGILKNLEDAIQNLLDVCALLVRELDLGIPGEESGFIELLNQNKLIDDEAGSKLNSLRGLRNRLVHAYGTVDDAVIHKNITENLGDFQKVAGSLRQAAKQLK